MGNLLIEHYQWTQSTSYLDLFPYFQKHLYSINNLRDIENLNSSEVPKDFIYFFCNFVCRFLLQNNLLESPIVYMSPDISKHMSLFAWDICNRQNFVLQTVPYNIYRYLKTANMGIFDKLKPKFEEMAKKR